MDEHLLSQNILSYIQCFHELDIELLRSSDDSLCRRTIIIDISDLLSHSLVFVNMIYEHPLDLLFKLQSSFQDIFKDFKVKIDIRLSNPPTPFVKPSINSLGSSDSNKLVSITGTVILCGTIKSLALEKSFQCSSCAHVFPLKASLDLYNSFELPAICQNKKCRSTSFTEVPGSEEWTDYREVKINDAFHSAHRGRLPESLWVILTSEQVSLCVPGDDVSITGVLIHRWSPLIKGQTIEMQLALYSTDIQVYSSKLQRPLLEVVEFPSVFDFQFRSCIVQSFSPQIFGLDHIKLGILLCIIGGIREDVQSLHLRGHSHCLLIGEPGTGKSNLLRESCKMVSRGIYTNAIGASKAGLTLSAVKEGNDWMLEAGALVLADSGLCALDDLAFLNKEDFSEIYEAMENQTISVAKAGMVCTVNTRTTIIAGCRPKKSRFDAGLGLGENSNLPDPLLSRFDLIFLIVDGPNGEKGNQMFKFILDRKKENDNFSVGQLQYLIGKSVRLKPTFSKVTEDLVNKYFEIIRKEFRKDVTMRQLESLLRLSQAHAKLCQREQVEIVDCISAIMLYESTFRGIGITKHISFVNEVIFQLGFTEILSHLGYDNFEIDDSILK